MPAALTFADCMVWLCMRKSRETPEPSVPYAVKLLDSAYCAKREKEMAERHAAWDSTPRKLFGRDLEAAKAAGWRFERDSQGYNGNPPALHAISPIGYRYRWNSCMMHGGADPWEPVGQDIEQDIEQDSEEAT